LDFGNEVMKGKPNGVRLWGLGSVRVFGSGSYQAPASTPSLSG
jgi:hypothetical protein